jgi:hypothetical protein
VIAHVSGMPIEELLPAVTGAGAGMFAMVRARFGPRVRRRRERR